MFLVFGATIAATLLTVLVVLSVTSAAAPTWRQEWARAQRFVVAQFARTWESPPERADLARSLVDEFDATVVLLDGGRRPIERFGAGDCRHAAKDAPVVRRGETVGYVRVCFERSPWMAPWRFVLPLAAAACTLWAASGLIARRLARPVDELVRVARDLGAGRLQSRIAIREREVGELGVVGHVVNDMADRIEKQLAAQRALLATVSHEIRTPLARIRLLTEMARDAGAPARPLDDIDREVLEVDALVSELLASSRLDFSALTPVSLDAVDVAAKAVERAGVEPSRVKVVGAPGAFRGDATLVSRAVSNLVENARGHGQGLDELRVSRRGGLIVFEALDRGPGFAPGDEARAFEPFATVARGAPRGVGSVGLGLSLVRRIAEAHGGRAYAHNREGGGACVGVEFAADGEEGAAPLGSRSAPGRHC